MYPYMGILSNLESAIDYPGFPTSNSENRQFSHFPKDPSEAM